MKKTSNKISEHFSNLGKRSWEVRKRAILKGNLGKKKVKSKLSPVQDKNTGQTNEQE